MNRQVATGGAAGAVTILAVWIVGLFGVQVPPEVASAFTVLVGTAGAWIAPAPTAGKHAE